MEGAPETLDDSDLDEEEPVLKTPVEFGQLISLPSGQDEMFAQEEKGHKPATTRWSDYNDEDDLPDLSEWA